MLARNWKARGGDNEISMESRGVGGKRAGAGLAPASSADEAGNLGSSGTGSGGKRIAAFADGYSSTGGTPRPEFAARENEAAPERGSTLLTIRSSRDLAPRASRPPDRGEARAPRLDLDWAAI